MLKEENATLKKQNGSLPHGDVALRQEDDRFSHMNAMLKIAVGHRASFTQETVTPKRDNAEHAHAIAMMKKVNTEMV